MYVGRRKYGIKDEKIVLDLYSNQRYSFYKIHKEYKYGHKFVSSILKKNCITIRNHSQALTIKDRKISIDENFFSNPQIEEQAYWIGFLAADGNVSNNILQINLKSNDRNHLQKFKKSIQSNHKITTFKRKTAYGDTSVCRIAFGSIRLCETLKKYNIVSNKTKSFIPAGIPLSAQRHFWRGYLDGDGTINKSGKYWTIGICGNYQTCQSFIQFIKKNMDFEPKIGKDKNIFSVRFGGIALPQSIGHLLYDGSTIFSKRKKLLYNKMIKAQPKTINSKIKYYYMQNLTKQDEL